MRINNICGYFESFITGFLQNFRQNKYPIFLYNNNSNKYIHNFIKTILNKDIDKLKLLTYKNNLNIILSEFNKNNIITTDILNSNENFNKNELIILLQCILLNIINMSCPILIITNEEINKLVFSYFNNNNEEEIQNNILYCFKPNYFSYDLLKINC